MTEITIVRQNLMTEKGYSLYCGRYYCSHNMPRTKWDATRDQFICACGWVSEFPKDFIDRYKMKWGK